MDDDYQGSGEATPQGGRISVSATTTRTLIESAPAYYGDDDMYQYTTQVCLSLSLSLSLCVRAMRCDAI